MIGCHARAMLNHLRPPAASVHLAPTSCGRTRSGGAQPRDKLLQTVVCLSHDGLEQRQSVPAKCQQHVGYASTALLDLGDLMKSVRHIFTSRKFEAEAFPMSTARSASLMLCGHTHTACTQSSDSASPTSTYRQHGLQVQANARSGARCACDRMLSVLAAHRPRGDSRAQAVAVTHCAAQHSHALHTLATSSPTATDAATRRNRSRMRNWIRNRPCAARRCRSGAQRWMR